MRWTLNKFTSILGGMDTHLSFKLIKESSKMENCFSTLQVTESYRRLLILHVGQHYAQSMRMTSLARCVCVVRFPMLLPFLFWAATWAHTHNRLTFYLDVTIFIIASIVPRLYPAFCLVQYRKSGGESFQFCSLAGGESLGTKLYAKKESWGWVLRMVRMRLRWVSHLDLPARWFGGNLSQWLASCFVFILSSSGY